MKKTKMYDVRTRKGWSHYNFKFPFQVNLAVTEEQAIFIDGFAEKFLLSKQIVLRMAVSEFIKKHKNDKTIFEG